jgi:hypothetical protein
MSPPLALRIPPSIPTVGTMRIVIGHVINQFAQFMPIVVCRYIPYIGQSCFASVELVVDGRLCKFLLQVNSFCRASSAARS